MLNLFIGFVVGANFGLVLFGIINAGRSAK